MNTTQNPVAINWRVLPFRLNRLAALFTCGGTLNTAANLHQAREISDQDMRWYVFFWVWTAARFTDVHQAAAKQHRCHTALTMEGLERRFARCNSLKNRWLAQRFVGYLLHPTGAANA